jgi:hypothetical protein
LSLSGIRVLSNSTQWDILPTIQHTPPGPGVGVIVGAVLGSLVGLGVIGGLLYWFVFRKKQKQAEGFGMGGFSAGGRASNTGFNSVNRPQNEKPAAAGMFGGLFGKKKTAEDIQRETLERHNGTVNGAYSYSNTLSLKRNQNGPAGLTTPPSAAYNADTWTRSTLLGPNGQPNVTTPTTPTTPMSPPGFGGNGDRFGTLGSNRGGNTSGGTLGRNNGNGGTLKRDEYPPFVPGQGMNSTINRNNGMSTLQKQQQQSLNRPINSNNNNNNNNTLETLPAYSPLQSPNTNTNTNTTEALSPGSKLKIIYPHLAGLEDELNVGKSDIVRLKETYADGWCWVEMVTSNQTQTTHSLSRNQSLSRNAGMMGLNGGGMGGVKWSQRGDEGMIPVSCLDALTLARMSVVGLEDSLEPGWEEKFKAISDSQTFSSNNNIINNGNFNNGTLGSNGGFASTGRNNNNNNKSNNNNKNNKNTNTNNMNGGAAAAGGNGWDYTHVQSLNGFGSYNFRDARQDGKRVSSLLRPDSVVMFGKAKRDFGRYYDDNMKE